MELENTPVEIPAQSAPPTETKGDFGWKSSTPAVPAEPDSNSISDAPADVAESNNTPAAAEATPVSDNWFDIPDPVESSDAAASGDADATSADSGTSAQAQQDWKEILKSIPREELLRELGIEEDDEFEKEFKKFRRSGGDPTKYLEAKSKDWTKVPDSDLAMLALAEQYPGLEKNELQKLFDNAYMQTEMDSDEDREIGALKLKSAASKQRAAMIAQQKEFTIPEISAPEADKDAVIEEYRQRYIQEAEQTIKSDNDAYMAHPTTQSILNSKRVAVPIGKDGSFNIGVNPDLIVGYFVNPEIYQKYQFDAQGEPDMQTEQAIAAIRILGLGNYNQKLVDYAKAEATKSIVEEGQNIRKPGTVVPTPTSHKSVWRST